MNQEAPQILLVDYNNTENHDTELGDSAHVWSFLHNYTQEYCHEYLDHFEYSRASRFYFPKDRIRFIQDRVNLKNILSLYTGINPWDVLISYSDYGKPFLKNSGIMFNVSHSEDLSVYAVSRSEIGIDIEKIRDIPYFEDIMRYFFTKKEAELVNSLEELQRAEAFLKIWTQKEAIAKMLGKGLGMLGRDMANYNVESFSTYDQYVGAVVYM